MGIAKFIKPALAEFVGMAIFLFTVTVSGAGTVGNPIPRLEMSFVFGITIFALVSVFGPVSGGHFNPAVTVGLTLAKAIEPIGAAIYILAQILGAIAGSFLARVVTTLPSQRASCLIINSLANDVSGGQAYLGELIMTCLLVFAVLVITAKNSKANQTTGPYVIGLIVFIAHIVLIPIDNCSINPARSLAASIGAESIPDFDKLANCAKAFDDHFVFWLGPLSGAIVAFILFKFVFASEVTGDDDDVASAKASYNVSASDEVVSDVSDIESGSASASASASASSASSSASSS